LVALVAAPIRPAWRGRLHRWAAFIVVPCFVALTFAADPVGDRVACAVYGLAVFTMLAVSATYHAASTPPVWKARLRPIDHSTIFLAIAGSYTGIATLALAPAQARPLIIVVWVGAVVGIAVRVSWTGAPMAILALVYVVVGWSALLEIGPLFDGMATVAGVLVVLGGVVYTAGAVVFALRKPDPAPAVFGYHEVFHALVVLGVALHFTAAAILVASH
jgi:hemolysin III